MYTSKKKRLVNRDYDDVEKSHRVPCSKDATGAIYGYADLEPLGSEAIHIARSKLQRSSREAASKSSTKKALTKKKRKVRYDAIR